jgi:hypothetical protein
VVTTVNRLAATGLGIATEKPENVLQSLGACYSPTAVMTLETQCDNGLPESGSSIFLVGDSQAESAADGVFQAATELGIRAFGYGAGGCPMRSRSTVKESAWCPDVQHAYLSAIEKFAPKTVIIANRYDQYAVEGSELGANDLRIPFADGKLPINRLEQNQTIIESLVEQIERVRELGPNVIVMLETPTVSMSSSTVLTKYIGGSRSNENTSAQNFNRVRDELIVQISERLSSINGVVIVNPQEYLCEKYPECSAVINGAIAYWEKQHVNRFGSLKLVPLWMKALAELNGASGG